MDKKSARYDRQLRLWKAHGQQALESASLCLLGATALGSEILKNLILPGIGSFTIIDGNNVTEADLGTHFFLPPNSLGKALGEAMVPLLLELNEEVSGSFLQKDPDSLIQNDPSFFTQFSLVIVTNPSEKTILQLADICWKAHIPLVVARVYGFFGYLRLVVPEHAVVETHPDQIVDLRLDAPFPDLVSFADTFDFYQMDSMTHGHVPFGIILLKAVQEWKEKNGGKLPTTTQEKQAFKSIITGWKNLHSSDCENFDEALAAAYRAWTPSRIPESIQRLLTDPKTDSLDEKSTDFWFLVKALKEFIAHEGHGLIPLPGIVPDMKADTESYVKLQILYRQKARSDIDSLTRYLISLLEKAGKRVDWIPQESIERFCKHAGFLSLSRYRSLGEEYSTNIQSSLINRHLQDLDDHLVIYVLLRASDRFSQVHHRVPGAHSEDVEGDIALLKRIVIGLLGDLGVQSHTIVPDDWIHEMVRAGSSEMANLAGIMGGIASQEIIKLITKQYVPLNNTLIFNGIKSTIGVYQL